MKEGQEKLPEETGEQCSLGRLGEEVLEEVVSQLQVGNSAIRAR